MSAAEDGAVGAAMDEPDAVAPEDDAGDVDELAAAVDDNFPDGADEDAVMAAAAEQAAAAEPDAAADPAAEPVADADAAAAPAAAEPEAEEAAAAAEPADAEAEAARAARKARRRERRARRRAEAAVAAGAAGAAVAAAAGAAGHVRGHRRHGDDHDDGGGERRRHKRPRVDAGAAMLAAAAAVAGAGAANGAADPGAAIAAVAAAAGGGGAGGAGGAGGGAGGGGHGSSDEDEDSNGRVKVYVMPLDGGMLSGFEAASSGRNGRAGDDLARSALRAWPHTRRLARFTAAKIADRVAAMGGSIAEPLVMFLPASDFAGRTLASVVRDSVGSLINAARLAFLLAQAVRGHGSLFVHAVLDQVVDAVDGAKPAWVGYYVFMYPMRYPWRARHAARNDAPAAPAHVPGVPRPYVVRYGPDGNPLPGEEAREAAALAGLPDPVEAAEAAEAERKARPREANTRTLSVQDWARRRLVQVLSAGRSLQFLKELEDPSYVEYTQAGRAAAVPKGQMSAAQAGFWDVLKEFGTVASVRRMIFALRPPVPPAAAGAIGDGADGGDAAAAAHAAMEAALNGGAAPGSWEARRAALELPNIARELFSPEAAVMACAIERARVFGAASRYVDEQARADAVRAELQTMHRAVDGTPGVFPPLTGVDAVDALGANTFRVPRGASHPRILAQYAMPHLTPPIDRASPMYLTEFERMRHHVGMATQSGRPTAAFHAHYMCNIGTTAAHVDGTDLEAVINEMRAQASAALTSTSPAAMRAHLERTETVAERLDAILLAPAAQLPDGIADAAAFLRVQRQLGRSTADVLGATLNLQNASLTLQGDLLTLLMRSMDAGFTMTHLHLYTVVVWLNVLNGSYDPLFAPLLQPSIIMSGHAGSSKSFVARIAVEAMLIVRGAEVTFSTAMANMTDESHRGNVKYVDELPPEAADCKEEATNQKAARDAVRSSAQIRSAGANNQFMVTNATRARTTVEQFEFGPPNAKGRRARIRDVRDATKLMARIGCCNWSVALLTARWRRRTIFIDVPQPAASGAGFITSAREGVDTQCPRRMIMEASSDACKTAHVLQFMHNLLDAVGASSHTMEGFTAAYDQGTAADKAMRDIGTYHKARMMAISMVNLTATLRLAARIGAPDPLTPLAPCHDALFARAHLYANAEHTANAIDFVFGPSTNQFTTSGTMYVIAGLRKLFSVDPARWADDAALILTSPPANAFPDADKYAMLPDFFNHGESFDRKITLLSAKLIELTESCVLQQTIEICVQRLTMPTENLQTGANDRRRMRALQPIVRLDQEGAPAALFVLKTYLLCPPTVMVEGVINRAFQPGTRDLWFRTQLAVNPADPAAPLVHTRTRESVAASIFKTDCVATIVAKADAYVAYNNTVKHLAIAVGSVCEEVRTDPQLFVVCVMELNIDTFADAAEVLRHVGDILRHVFHVDLPQTVATVLRNVGVTAAASDVCTSRAAYYDTLTAEAVERAACVGQAHKRWFEQMLFNPAYTNKASLELLIAMNWCPTEAMSAFTDTPRCKPTRDVFGVAASMHLQTVCGVRPHLTTLHCAHPANVRMLEKSSQVVNAAATGARVELAAYAAAYAPLAAALRAIGYTEPDVEADADSVQMARANAPPGTPEERIAASSRRERTLWGARTAAAARRRAEQRICAAVEKVLEAGGPAAPRRPSALPTRAVLHATRMTFCLEMAHLALAEGAFMWRLRSTLAGLNYPISLTRCDRLVGARSGWAVARADGTGSRTSEEYVRHTLASFLYAVIVRLVYDRTDCREPFDPLATAWTPRMHDIGAKVRAEERRLQREAKELAVRRAEDEAAAAAAAGAAMVEARAEAAAVAAVQQFVYDEPLEMAAASAAAATIAQSQAIVSAKAAAFMAANASRRGRRRLVCTDASGPAAAAAARESGRAAVAAAAAAAAAASAVAAAAPEVAQTPEAAAEAAAEAERAADPTSRLTFERMYVADYAYTEPRDPLCPKTLVDAVDVFVAAPQLLPPFTVDSLTAPAPAAAAGAAEAEEQKQAPPGPLEKGLARARVTAALLCRPDAWHDVADHAEMRAYADACDAYEAKRAAGTLGPLDVLPMEPHRMAPHARDAFYATVIGRLQRLDRMRDTIATQLAWILMAELEWEERRTCLREARALVREVERLGTVDMDEVTRGRAACQMATSLAIQAGYGASVPRIVADVATEAAKFGVPATHVKMPACASLDPSKDELAQLRMVLGLQPVDDYVPPADAAPHAPPPQPQPPQEPAPPQPPRAAPIDAFVAMRDYDSDEDAPLVADNGAAGAASAAAAAAAAAAARMDSNPSPVPSTVAPPDREQSRAPGDEDAAAAAAAMLLDDTDAANPPLPAAAAPAAAAAAEASAAISAPFRPSHPPPSPSPVLFMDDDNRARSGFASDARLASAANDLASVQWLAHGMSMMGGASLEQAQLERECRGPEDSRDMHADFALAAAAAAAASPTDNDQ